MENMIVHSQYFYICHFTREHSTLVSYFSYGSIQFYHQLCCELSKSSG